MVLIIAVGLMKRSERNGIDFLGVDGRLCGTSFLREIKK